MDDLFMYLDLSDFPKIDEENRKDDIIKASKAINSLIKDSRATSKLTECYYCGKTCDGFCNSHTLPAFCLRNIAEKGKVLMSIDYSQVELRVLTSLCEDPNLIKAYKEDKDLHDLTARGIFNLSDDEDVSREQRIIAKIINFSIIYGKTPFGLAKELKIPVKDASEYIDRYFKQYPKVTVFEREIIEEAEEKGYVTTLFGRKRFIAGINSNNKNIKSQSERMAVNTVIQGTAAEIIKKVMIEVAKNIKDKNDISLLLQVHDELIFEIDENSIEKYSTFLSDIMTNTIKLKNVDLKININVGSNWAKAK